VAPATIREATPADAAFYAELMSLLGYPASEEQARNRMSRLDGEGQRLFVAELDGELAGIAVVHVYPLPIHDAPICRLVVLVVAEWARRRGVGRTLIRAVEAEARSAGCDRIVLESGLRRDEAHEFYRALGYENYALEFRKLL
jgi:GNAT superfamily N-acetyltransferase